MPPQPMDNWHSFESLIKIILAKQQDVKLIKRSASLAGHQVDFYVEAESPRGKTIKTAVEAKYSQSLITDKTVAEFSRIVAFLRKSEVIDRGILVAYKGFTQKAIRQARDSGVELLSLALLEANVQKYGPIPQYFNLIKKEPLPETPKKLIFVLMPFSKNLKDLYLYGIRGAAQKTGYACRRADELEHNRDVLKETLYYIENADVLVAEVTINNPNVYYEVGIAHGKNKDVILLTRKRGKEIPFDLRGKNHITYDSISDLEEKLVKRIEGGGWK